MDSALFERLFWTAENETLDFKRDQYPFALASDEEKSELLKDILAFANSWQSEPAHILIDGRRYPASKETIEARETLLAFSEINGRVKLLDCRACKYGSPPCATRPSKRW